MSNDQIQTVILELSDGRKLTFSGPAQLLPKEEEEVRVVGIAFTVPRPMPPGATFEIISKAE